MSLADSYNQFWGNTGQRQGAPTQNTLSPGSRNTITGGQPLSNLEVPQPTASGGGIVGQVANIRGQGPGQGQPAVGGNNFNIPTNLFPSSQSTQRNRSSQSSHSGINWDTDLASGLLGQLISGGQSLPGLANQMGTTLQNQYGNMMDRAMNADNFQGTLNDLARKGMLSSTVAGDTMASAGSNIARMVSDKAYDSRLNQLNAQMQVPSLIADIVGLAQESSSQGGSSGSSSSSQSNPLAPYELMAQMMMY